jgi:hypothetical protein
VLNLKFHSISTTNRQSLTFVPDKDRFPFSTRKNKNGIILNRKKWDPKHDCADFSRSKEQFTKRPIKYFSGEIVYLFQKGSAASFSF